MGPYNETVLTSGQIAGTFAQQNQYFAGAAQYSHQISQQMGSPYGAQMGGPQGFSYGGSGSDFSGNVAGGVVSAAGGAAQFAVGGGAIMAGMGMLGRGGSALLDPFSGAVGGYKMGGRMGLGMAGRLGMGAMGALPAAAVLGGATHAIGSMVSGAREQSAVENALGRNQFLTPGMNIGRFGGFDRQQAAGVGSMMQRMSTTPDMMTDMGELTRIMDKMGQMGVMSGMRDANEFQKKFKENIKVLKEVSKVMASSMEEALPLFGEIKRTGFYSTGDILKNALSRRITGGATGMDQGQVGQLAAAGSQLSFQTGGTRKTGARHALRVANQLGAAKRVGALSEDDVMEMTGMGGAAGMQALSQQLTVAGYKMSRGALGTATSIALAETDEEGRFTGSMDEDLMERFRSGDIDRGELMRMARGKTRSRASKMSYVAQRKRLRSEMAGSMGVTGQMSMLRNVLGERGFNNPDALRIVSQRFGLDEREADMMVDLGRRMPDIQIGMQQSASQQAKKQAAETVMRENYSWDAVKRKAKQRISNVVTEPFKEVGRGIRDSIANAVDEFVEDVTGKYKVRVSEEMAQVIKESMAGVSSSRKRMSRMLSRHSGVLGEGLSRGADLSSGMAASAVNWVTGNETAGERMASNLAAAGSQYITHFSGSDAGSGVREQTPMDFLSAMVGKPTGADISNIAMEGARDQGVNVLTRDNAIFGSEDFVGADNQQIRRGRAALKRLARGEQTAGSRSALSLLQSGDLPFGKKLSGSLEKVMADNPELALLSGAKRRQAMVRALEEQSGGSFGLMKMSAGLDIGEAGTAPALAALEEFTGGGVGTGILEDIGAASSGLAALRSGELHAKRDDLAKEVRGMFNKQKMGDVGEEFMSLVDEGITDGGIFLSGLRGLGDDATETQKSKGRTARSIINKISRGKDLSDKEKKWARQNGIDTAMDPKKARRLQKVLGKVSRGDFSSKDIAKMLEFGDTSTVAQLFGAMDQLTDSGKSLGESIRKLQTSGGLSTKAKIIADRLADIGDSAAEANTVSNYLGLVTGEGGSILDTMMGRSGSYTEQLAEQAMGIATLSDEEQERFMSQDTPAELRAGVSRARLINRRAKRSGKRLTIGKLLPGFDSLSEAEKNRIFDLAATEEGEERSIHTRVSKKELEGGLAKTLVAEQAGRSVVTPEETEHSRFANPAEVSKNLSDLATITADTVQAVGDLRDGVAELKKAD